MAHDLLSPSSAHTWLACPGSIALASRVTDVEESSPYAEEGTRAHEAAERAVNALFESKPLTFLSDDPEMARCAQGWAEMLAKQCPRESVAFYATERQLDISGVTGRKGAHGTADFVAIDYDGLLTIADFKYGMGVDVSAEQNPQLSIYALAAIEEFSLHTDIKSVRLIIYQPRIDYREKVYSWELGALYAFGRRIKAAAKLAIHLSEQADIDPTTLVAGDKQCRFCKAKSICPALRNRVKSMISADFDVIDQKDLPVPSTAEQLAKALPWLDTIDRWCDAVRASALNQLQTGTAISGYKLVAGRKGTRKWVPNAEEQIRAMRINRNVLYTHTLISPTQAERAHKAGNIGPRQWQKIKQLMTQADGKPTIAPESDKRPAIAVSTKDDFQIIND